MAMSDPHSYFDDGQPRVRHLELDWRVDFDARVIEGQVTLRLAAPGQGTLDLDSRDLTIASVTVGGRPIPYVAGGADADDEVRGRRLRLDLPAGTRDITIAYRTSPDAIALQWLEPAQTEGGKLPFLYSQCQPIHARALVPTQDSPVARVTYDARVTVPADRTAVMSAGPVGDPVPTTVAGRPARTFAFAMPQAIPPYLLALAVGELEARDLSPRSRVWAEPATVARAAHEFAGVEAMITTAEGLFGPYDWERFDMLVLPPAFPYGGMENPRMTFLTPTIIAGDRSLVDVVSHELAHSWTGNLISNASAEHFWLNEGWTVWADRRIQEALHGEGKAALDWIIGGHGLAASLERLADTPALTHLRTRLDGVDPDLAYSVVPYEKGARLLVLLERAAGRPRWDAFVRDYIARFRFTSITTEQFLALLDEKLPGLAAQVGVGRWIDGPGLPDDAPVFASPTVERVAALCATFARDHAAPEADVRALSPTLRIIFLQRLPRTLPAAACAWLDRVLALSSSGNHEILVEWLTIAAGSAYQPAFGSVRDVLLRVGRMKYLRPLYSALGRTEVTRALGRAIFAEAAPRYHTTSRKIVASVLAGWPGDGAQAST